MPAGDGGTRDVGAIEMTGMATAVVHSSCIKGLSRFS